MTTPDEVTPDWGNAALGDGVEFCSAEVVLSRPRANPSETATTVYLNVYREDGGYRWSCYYQVPIEAPFDEGSVAWASSVDLEGAKAGSWGRAITFLRELEYSDDEIVEAVSRPAGSLELDLDDDDDEDE